MKYYYNLYLDQKTIQKKEKIIKNLKESRFQFSVFLICVPNSKKNHLEIYDSAYLVQKKISKEEIFVVGIASGHKDALKLVEKITQEVYDETAGTDIRSYLLQKQQEYEEGNV